MPTPCAIKPGFRVGSDTCGQIEPLANKMWSYGRRLHEFFGLKPPEGRGTIQVGSVDEASMLYEDATSLGLRSEYP